MKKTFNLICIVLSIIWIINKCSEDNNNDSHICTRCGKEYSYEEKSYYSEGGYYVYASSDCCAKCSIEESKERERNWMKGEIKKARNKWVDDNPEKAKRRGIEKF